MTALLDVNVLLALAWSNHAHHVAASAWFLEHRREGWATCILTESSFVRLSCNPAVVQDTVTPLDAVGALKALMGSGSHAFWPMDWSIVDLPDSIGTRIQGYRQVTDAVLLATAMRQGGQLATLDVGMEVLVPTRERHFLCVIPV